MMACTAHWGALRQQAEVRPPKLSGRSRLIPAGQESAPTDSSVPILLKNALLFFAGTARREETEVLMNLAATF